MYAQVGLEGVYKGGTDVRTRLFSLSLRPLTMFALRSSYGRELRRVRSRPRPKASRPVYSPSCPSRHDTRLLYLLGYHCQLDLVQVALEPFMTVSSVPLDSRIVLCGLSRVQGSETLLHSGFKILQACPSPSRVVPSVDTTSVVTHLILIHVDYPKAYYTSAISLI